VRIDSVVTLREDELTSKHWRNLFHALTFEDNDGNVIQAFEHLSGRGEVVLPRGALDMVNVPVEVTDLRSRPRMPVLKFARELDTNGFRGQRAAVETMFAKEQGQLRCPTGSGKTEIGLAFAAACGTRTLVLVHTKDLMRQWVERAKVAIPGVDVGTIQGSTCEIGHITVAMAQSIKRHLGDGRGFWGQFGALVIDESHHSSAETWEWILNVCPAYYRFGLSASSKRSDGRMPLVRFNVGPVIYKLRFRPQVEMVVQPLFSNFRSRYSATQWTRLVAELVRDDERNLLLAEVCAKMVEEGRVVLLLSRQILHLEKIAEKLPTEMAGHYRIVTGHLPQRKRNEYIQAMRDRELALVLGTQLWEEGVDVPVIDGIVLAFPGTDVTTLQKIGRGSRKADGKTGCEIVDVVDPHVAVLVRQWTQRRTFYKSAGVKIANAVRYVRPEQRRQDAEAKEGRDVQRRWRVRRSRGAAA